MKAMGGSGGGLTGGVGQHNRGSNNSANYANNTSYMATASGQTSSGTGGTATGSFGIGANGPSHCIAGAGGGWYGGRTNLSPHSGGTDYIVAGANGGSSFISGYPGCVAIVDSDTNTANPRQHKTGADSENTTIHGVLYRFSDYQMIAGNEAMPDWSKDKGETMVGNQGNGHARIRLL